MKPWHRDEKALNALATPRCCSELRLHWTRVCGSLPSARQQRHPRWHQVSQTCLHVSRTATVDLDAEQVVLFAADSPFSIPHRQYQQIQNKQGTCPWQVSLISVANAHWGAAAGAVTSGCDDPRCKFQLQFGKARGDVPTTCSQSFEQFEDLKNARTQHVANEDATTTYHEKLSPPSRGQLPGQVAGHSEPAAERLGRRKAPPVVGASSLAADPLTAATSGASVWSGTLAPASSAPLQQGVQGGPTLTASALPAQPADITPPNQTERQTRRYCLQLQNPSKPGCSARPPRAGKLLAPHQLVGKIRSTTRPDELSNVLRHHGAAFNVQNLTAFAGRLAYLATQAHYATSVRAQDRGQVLSHLKYIAIRTATRVQPLLLELDMRAVVGLLHSFGKLARAGVPLSKTAVLPVLGDLLYASGQHLAQLGPQAASTLIYALGCLKLRPSRTWIVAYCRATVPLLEDSTPQGLCCMLGALARLRLRPDPGWLIAYQEAALTQLPEFDPRGLSQLAWAHARLELPLRQDLAVGVMRSAARSMLSFRPQALSTLMWSVAVLGIVRDAAARGPGRRWYSRGLQQVFAEMAHYSPVSLATVLYACARVNRMPPGGHAGPWMQRFYQVMLPKLDGCDAHTLSNMLYSHAKLQMPMPSGALMERVLTAVGAALVRGAQPHALATSAWATARLGGAPGPVWLHTVEDLSCESMQLFNAEELSGLSWGLARLGHRPGAAWLEAFDCQLLERMREHSGQQVADMLEALAAFQHAPGQPWLAALSQQLQVVADKLTVSQVSIILTSLATLKARPAMPALSRLAVNINAHVVEMNGKQLAGSLTALAALQVHFSPTWLQLLCGELQTELTKLPASALTSLISALGSLQHNPGAAWLTSCHTAVERLTATMDGNQLCSVLQAYASLQYVPPQRRWLHSCTQRLVNSGAPAWAAERRKAMAETLAALQGGNAVLLAAQLAGEAPVGRPAGRLRKERPTGSAAGAEASATGKKPTPASQESRTHLPRAPG